MSQNHPHDNIYSILGKLNALKPTPQEKYESVLKQIHESVEAKGSILQGVDAVQARLAEQFAKEGVVDSLRAKNYDRLSKRSYDQADKTKPGGVSVYNVDKINKGDDRAAKAAELRGDKVDEVGNTPAGLAAVRQVGAECETCGNAECSCKPMEENVTNVGTYGTEYYKSDDFTGGAEDEAKAKKKATKVVRHGVKGRPAKEKPPVYSKMNDPFGRVPDKAPKSKVAGRKVAGTAQSAPQKSLAETMLQVERRLTEGVNFQKLMQDKHQTVDEMLAELSNDMQVFKTTGHCSELLKDCMEIKSAHGKLIADEATDPTNPFYKKQNDYNLPPAVRGHGTADYKLPDVKAHDNRHRDDYRDRAGLAPAPVAEELELAKLAELAGITVKESFGHKPDDDGDRIPNWADKNPDVAGGDEDRKMSEDDMEEGNLWGQNVRDAKAAGKTQADLDNDGNLDPVTETGFDMGQQETPDITINSTVDSDGKKTVNINAEGERAVELLQMLQMAGMGNSDKAQELRLQEPVEVEIMGEPDCEEVAEEELSNSPDPKYFGVYDEVGTLGTGEADNGEKAMHGDRPTFKNGDNPLTKPSTTLEARLAAEYESIKKVSN